MSFSLNRDRVIKCVIIVSLFLEFLDQTIITTAIPVIARDFAISPLDLKFGLTSYYLALVLVIPASGWIGDRFGARRIFLLAMALFTTGSLLCGLSNSLASLVGARFLQGAGGALLVPVGRIIILREVEQAHMIKTLAWLSLPAVFGPMLGPLVGGTITSTMHWPWIFWINLPIGIVALVLACIFLEDSEREQPHAFDIAGYAIISAGLTLIVSGCALLLHATLSPATGLICLVLGVLILGSYPRYCKRRRNNLLDASLFELPTFRASMLGGIPFRVANGSVPFLLPIFFQTGLGFSSFQSGVLVFASGVAAMFMNSRIAGLLQIWGFRELLVVNGLICALFLSVLTIAIPHLAFFWMIAFLFVFGLFRSIQYSCLMALAYADVGQKQLLSSATSIVSISHPLSNSIGVSLGAIFLEISMVWRGGIHTPVAADFPSAFLMIALIGLLSAISFYTLSRDAGRAMTGRI